MSGNIEGNDELLAKLKAKDEEILHLRTLLAQQNKSNSLNAEKHCCELSKDEVARYSRQILVPEFGVKGQVAARNASVLIVGAGGLGCPSAAYLAAAGIGTIGIVDYDDVEKSNLHRQILHSEAKEALPKADSLVLSLKQLNSQPLYRSHKVLLDSKNAKDIIRDYDIVVDATDNVATRYLLNDACILVGRPLVSGSALRWEGQLTVYGYRGGPCYRCLFPSPPPSDTVTNCSEGGVIGMVPGVIGCLQALEVMKIITGCGAVLSGKLLILDGLSGRVRTIVLRQRSSACALCGDSPSVTDTVDYIQFCGAGPNDKAPSLSILPSEKRISCTELEELRGSKEPFLLLDVRPAAHFEICHLPGSIKRLSDIKETLSKGSLKQAFVVCRRGNDSQRAVQFLQESLGDSVTFRDIVGGLTAWASIVDPKFPIY
ncbi:adenylyltransferase and sulfurtransferase MOCS3-like isoform X2 [Ornithodoros turicata]|uniref:adenylyltransferase and sulfurtransferase MOCS3-like isoform X2 n=1 Tax=Ornithodoros turicata TaxID=34597 RepID=UPI003138E231